MKKHFIIAAVLLTNVLSMQAIMTVAGRVAAGLKRTPRNVIQVRSYQSIIKPEYLYNIDDLVRKAQEMEFEHGSKVAFLQDVPLLQFDNPKQAMEYFKRVDLEATQAASEKRYNIYDIVRKAEKMEIEHGSKVAFLQDVSLLQFDNPSQTMAYFKLIDLQATQGKADLTSPAQFIESSKQQAKK